MNSSMKEQGAAVQWKTCKTSAGNGSSAPLLSRCSMHHDTASTMTRIHDNES
jgi:hypothetical protein